MEHKCLNCGIGEEVVLFSCIYNGEPVYVCLKCLPGLVQGARA